MHIRRSHRIAAAAVAATLLFAACSSDADDADEESTSEESTTTVADASADESTDTTEAASGEEPGTIVEVAADAGSFTTLLAAAEAADLVSVLEGEGPYTVFAPTDEAFEKVDPATLEALLADPEALADVLTYHVVAGEVTSDMIEPGDVTTVNGAPLTISVDGSTVKVGDATVTTADVMASNGVIHVIDTVLIPPAS